MEPDIMHLHSSSPPPLDGDGDGDMGSEIEEFGDFSVGVSCSPVGLVDAIEPPALFRPPSPTTKPETHQPNSCFNQSVEQSQQMSTVKSKSDQRQFDLEGQNFSSESSLHLTNGYVQEDRKSGASVVHACSPTEETGFADFTVFTEQLSHPWCCGFTEQWDDKAVGSSSSVGEETCKTGQEVIMESEPRSQHVNKANKDVCVRVKHCEKKDGALMQPPQDHHQPQEAAAALNFASGEEDPGTPRDTQGERRCSCNSLQTLEWQGNTENVPQTFTMYESTSDLASFSDDLSFEGVSADLEPNVSSLGSQDDHTDCDRTDDEQEELGNYRHSACHVSSSMTNLSLSESEKDFYYCSNYATQESSATSSQPQSGTNKKEKSADFTDSSIEHHLNQESVLGADAGVQSLGSLPPSDSFADFCSAPTQEDGEGLWADFKEQSAQVEEKTWTHFRKPVSNLQTKGDDEEEQERAEQHGVTRRNSCQATLSCHVQQLFQSSFPEVVVPAMEGEEELLFLSVLLQTQHFPESEEVMQELSHAQRIQQVMLGPHQDIHSSVGLQFQWSGSHSNMTLLRCLGVDSRNIVFIGKKKQPVTVPAYASSLGMLEPIKDSFVPAVCSPKHSAVTAPGSPREKPNTSTHSVQEELPSTQLDWTSRGLSSSQDGSLDYFGPEEESSSNNSSRATSPPPGVDRELYEFTISKLESSNISSHLEDTLNHLMSTAEQTSITLRKSLSDEELGAEAGWVIAGLPNLSFMQAKFLMFPSVLTPKHAAPQNDNDM
ncbi:aftiphilin isoform X2 [Melanotaenia boesemani]|uniref:aftiphilin isoform X2 n=1 Tax=Melanotaenia boesemani TaxID=1250792 RepID=UPI001C046D16|nr:aftiphilin isoform X2 [Melanotaenia boesemani]